jgi:hypothetical protein
MLERSCEDMNHHSEMVVLGWKGELCNGTSVSTECDF